jgi:hypothetical protein
MDSVISRTASSERFSLSFLFCGYSVACKRDTPQAAALLGQA